MFHLMLLLSCKICGIFDYFETLKYLKWYHRESSKMLNVYVDELLTSLASMFSLVLRSWKHFFHWNYQLKCYINSSCFIDCTCSYLVIHVCNITWICKYKKGQFPYLSTKIQSRLFFPLPKGFTVFSNQNEYF